MAAYAKTATLLADLTASAESLHNTVEKSAMDSLLTLINTEFAKIVSDGGVTAYTPTTGLAATMIQKLDNYPNNVAVQILEDVINLLVSEFVAVDAGGTGYAITSGFAASLREYVQNFPNNEAKINLNFIFDSILAELALVALADA